MKNTELIPLSKYKSTKPIPQKFDIRTFAIKTDNDIPVGTVDDLLVDKVSQEIKYIIADFTPITNKSINGKIESRLAAVANDTTEVNHDNGLRLVPVGLVNVDEEAKSLTMEEKVVSKTVRYTSFDKNQKVDFETETTAQGDKVKMGNPRGQSMFDNGYIRDNSSFNKLFHNHYFSIEL